MNENPLRPMDIGSIIDRTFRIYRNNFSSMILFSLLIGGTASLIISLISLGAGAFQTDSTLGLLYSGLADGESFVDALAGISEASQAGSSVLSSLLSTLVSLLVSVFVTPLVTGGIVLITLSACNLRKGESGGYFSQVKKIYPELILTQLVLFVVIIALVIALMIPIVIILVAVAFGSSDSTFTFIIVMVVVALAAILIMVFSAPLFWMVFPVAIHENKFAFRSVGRAWKLFRKRFWKSIGLTLLVSIMIYVLSAVIGIIVAFLPPLVNVILTTVITSLLTPVSWIAVTLLYLDIRMTVEGYDLELRSAAMKKPAIAESSGSVNVATVAGSAENVSGAEIFGTSENPENPENKDD